MVVVPQNTCRQSCTCQCKQSQVGRMEDHDLHLYCMVIQVNHMEYACYVCHRKRRLPSSMVLVQYNFNISFYSRKNNGYLKLTATLNRNNGVIIQKQRNPYQRSEGDIFSGSGMNYDVYICECLDVPPPHSLYYNQVFYRL